VRPSPGKGSESKGRPEGCIIDSGRKNFHIFSMLKAPQLGCLLCCPLIIAGVPFAPRETAQAPVCKMSAFCSHINRSQSEAAWASRSLGGLPAFSKNESGRLTETRNAPRCRIRPPMSSWNKVVYWCYSKIQGVTGLPKTALEHKVVYSLLRTTEMGRNKVVYWNWRRR